MWAYGGSGQTYNYGLTFSDNSSDTQTINVTTPGALATWATSDANTELGGNTNWVWFDESYRPNEMKYTKLVVKGSLNADDLAVLQGEHFQKFTLVDMDEATLSGDVTAEQAGVMDFDGAEYISLPQGMNREMVKAFGETNKLNTNFKSAYCAQKHYNKVTSSTDSDIDEFICYVRKGGSLRSCINSTNSDPTNFVKKAQYLTIIGNAMPLDYVSGNVWGGKKVLSFDGHVSVSVDVSSTDVVFTGTGTVALSDNTSACTFMEADIVSLDLRDMRLYGPNMEADLTLSVLGYKPDKLKYVVLPIGDTNFKTLPAGCIGMLQSMLSINVPSTVEVMKSGSLFGSAMLCHVWTDGTDADKRYDYGAVLSVAADGTETKVYADDIVDQSPVYGTWTLPASLTYIETIITGAEHVKDLYVMATKAPVCEVDAFGSRMYIANNGNSAPSDAKIIDRDYYYSNTSGTPYAWTTMLHYPTETAAPDLQRYTDPTREYTAATGLKDDKGNTIYLPTQNEWNRAYWQGTTGYVWKAWKTERDENATIYIPGAQLPSFGYTSGMQSSANDAYDASWDADSYLSSFYDVTDGGSLTKPSTLENYYNVYWNESQYKLNNTGAGVQLYPEAETEGTGTYVDQPVYDANGNLEYVEADPRSEGTHVQVVSNEYVANNSGQYIKNYTITANDNGAKVLDYNYSEPVVGGKYYIASVYKPTNWAWDFNGTYYYLSSSYGVDPTGEGEWINTNEFNPNQQPYYMKVSDVKSAWNWSDEQIAQYTRYNENQSYEVWNNSPQGVQLYILSEEYKEWNESVGDVTRYDKEYTGEFRDYNADTDIDDARYDVTLGEGYRTASTEAPEKYLQHYAEEEVTSYVAATDEQKADESVNLYKVKTQRVEIVNVTNTNDYRGWHQFVLTSYSAFDKVPTIYEKMYTSDTDWWTICLPYDLTYSETMRYFSDGSTVPVVSKLQYVKRDAENKQITLCFTKNLMKNKEDFTNGGSLEGVHGDLDDNGVLKIQVGTAPAADDVVLHAGVAYLIKPTLPASASHTQQIKWTEEITGQALSAEEEADNALYSKITAAQRNESNWGDLVKNAIYTVPAFDIVSDGSLTVDGVKCQKSSEYTYSFVGSLFKSPMPTNCYFLGWDSTKNKAAFWYNKYSDPSDWNWGNMTGIICPNLTEGVSVTPAEGLSVAARWVLDGKMEDDSMGGEAGAKRMPEMLFEVDAPEGSAVTGISEIQKTETEGKTIYNLNGVRVSGSQNSLAKGVYIVNGKKVVVK